VSASSRRSRQILAQVIATPHYDLAGEVDSAEGDYLYQLISSDDKITKTP
jgi:hypothetical protein